MAEDGRLRAAHAELLDLKLEAVGKLRVVIDGELPQVVLFESEPFILLRHSPLIYRQVRPYRADARLLVEGGVMASAEHERRQAAERVMLSRYWPRRAGPSKADLQRELADAVRNTVAQQQPEDA